MLILKKVEEIFECITSLDIQAKNLGYCNYLCYLTLITFQFFEYKVSIPKKRVQKLF